jgi:hypothetical protein
MRWLLGLLAWLASLAVLAPICFFAVILLAGPHSSMLPGWLQSFVLLLGWLVVVVVPVWIARAVWRRTKRAAPGQPLF